MTLNGENRQLSFLDALNIASFLIGIQNLEANLDQNDKADLQHSLTVTAEQLLQEIHAHLELQDRKLDSIIHRLEGEHT